MLLFPWAFCIAASARKYQPAPFTLLSSQSSAQFALEDFSFSGLHKVSDPSYVGSTSPCMREAICLGLMSDHAEAPLCRRRKSPVLAEPLPGFPLLFPMANKRGVNAPAEHCRRGVNVILIKSQGPSLSSSCLFPACLPSLHVLTSVVLVALHITVCMGGFPRPSDTCYSPTWAASRSASGISG